MLPTLRLLLLLLLGATSTVARGAGLRRPITFPDAIGARHATVWTRDSAAAILAVTTHATKTEIPIHDLGDVAYYVDVQVGTPPQPLRMFVDLGASRSWVLGVPVGSCRTYNHSASSSYTPRGDGVTVELPLGATGVWAEDTLALSAAPDLGVPHQLFAEATKLPPIWAHVLEGGRADGVLGLGLSPRVDGGDASDRSFLHQLVAAGALEEPVIGLYYGTHGHDSQLVLGGYNQRHFWGDLIYLDVAGANPVSGEVEWAIALDDVEVPGLGALRGGRALLSTYLLTTRGPAVEIARLRRHLGATDRGVMPCQGPNLSFVVRDPHGLPHALTFAVADYTVPIDEHGERCFLLLTEDDPRFGTAGNNWVLGGMFLAKYYAVLDAGNAQRAPRIGVAMAVA